jgi:hypothetical protein
MSVTDNSLAGQSQEDSRRPCIIICNWDGGEPVWDLVEDLSGVPWAPDNARTELIEGVTDAEALAHSLVERLISHEARALLLIGRTRYDGPARLQIRAEIPKTDGHRLNEDGPGVVRATAPAAAILEAATKAKVALVASSNAEDDAGSALLYRVMTALEDHLETPAVAMIRFPSGMPEPQVAATIKAAASVMTQHFTPVQRPAAVRI